jgi:hypothetical protein
MSETTNIEFQDVAVVETGDNGAQEIFMKDLIVTDGNLRYLGAGSLLTRDDEGNLFSATVSEDGAAIQAPVLLGTDNIADASITGEKLAEGAVSARELDIEGLFSDTTLWNRMIASSLDAEELMSNETFVEQLQLLTPSTMNVAQKLCIGNFVLEQQSNGNLSLRRA